MGNDRSSSIVLEGDIDFDCDLLLIDSGEYAVLDGVSGDADPEDEDDSECSSAGTEGA